MTKVRTAYRMPPRARARRKVAARGIPFRISDGVVVSSAEELDARAPWRGVATRLVRGEVEVPELELGLGRGADGCEHDVTPTRGPAYSV